MPGIAPYKGLLFFDESDAGLFFGREASPPALPTGSRPSPWMPHPASWRSWAHRAAASPRSCVPGWRWRSSARLGDSYYHTHGRPPEQAGGELQPDQAQNNGQNHLLLVDQFEETFTLCRDENQRSAFIEKLLVHRPAIKR